MNEAAQWQISVSVILPHPVQPAILVCREENCWRLPQFSMPKLWVEPLDRLNDAVRERFGLETTVLQVRERSEDESTHQAQQTYLLENPGPALPLTGDQRWVGSGDLDEVEFARPPQRASVERYLCELETGVTPALRTPSARPGWRRVAEEWIKSQLAQAGYTITGPIELVRNWFLSCVLRAPTQQGQVYFKASHGTPLMVREAQLTQALAGLFPGALPTPIAIEPGQDWMLLADFGPEVGWGAPVETREAVLRSFARLQIASAGRVDELLALGCVDRRLTRLADQIDPLFHDAEMVDYLDEEQQRRLPATADRLKVLCDCLAHYRVPATLMHGDMHMSNVARRADDFLFFDWSDACITHPFLDMIEILHEREQEAQMRLCDSYLAQWTDYEPMERLLEMWKMAYPLCALHQAVSYQAILANTEDACKTELAWAIPHWFSKILTALDEEREPALRTSSSR